MSWTRRVSRTRWGCRANSASAGWAWGAKFLDFNGDGAPDIYSPNGYITNDDPDDL